MSKLTRNSAPLNSQPKSRLIARSGKLAAVALAGLLLSACITDQGNKQIGGALLGAAGGGLLGAQVGGGRGRLAAVAVGTLIGAFVGSEVGKSLDRADEIAIAGAQETAQEAPLNEPIHWRNAESGNYGTVTPIREGRTRSGQHCREFQHTVFIGGKAQKGYGTACLQPDGSWRLLNG